MAKKLYELSDERNAILDRIMDGLQGEELQAATEELWGTEEAFETKLVNAIKALRIMETDHRGSQDERSALGGQTKALKNGIESLRTYIAICLIDTNLDKVRTSVGTVSANETHGIDIADVDELARAVKEREDIPDNFITYEPKAEKDAIMEALENGDINELPPGVVATHKFGIRLSRGRKTPEDNA